MQYLEKDWPHVTTCHAHFGSDGAKQPSHERHTAICIELGDIYRRKNHDYGDSFHKTFLEEGFAMPRIRLTDKLERFKQLTRCGDQQVADESIRDTLLDLANYAIMTVMEMDRA